MKIEKLKKMAYYAEKMYYVRPNLIIEKELKRGKTKI